MYKETSTSSGWPALWGAVIGGVGGYLVGRNSGGPNHAAPGAFVAGELAGGAVGRQTCFQEGEYAGENRAGINYIAQKVTGNENRIEAVNQNLNDKFQALLQQKISDQAARIATLEMNAAVGASACQTQRTLDLIAQRLDGITTGCAVRSVPACPNSCDCRG